MCRIRNIRSGAYGNLVKFHKLNLEYYHGRRREYAWVVQVFYQISLHKYGNNYESRSTSETDLPVLRKFDTIIK